MEASRQELVFLDTKVHLNWPSNPRDLLKAKRLPLISKSQIMPSTPGYEENPVFSCLKSKKKLFGQESR